MRLTDETLLEEVLAFAAGIYAADEQGSLRSLITEPGSDLLGYLSDFVSRYEKKGKKTAMSKLDGLTADENFKSALKEALDHSKSAGGLFKRFFK